jgi:hypothetical protein
MTETESMKSAVAARLTKEFGPPSREVKKVKAWDHLPGKASIVLQVDQPTSVKVAYLWVPHRGEGKRLTDIIHKQYTAEAGRHSNTFPADGLNKGSPALKIIITYLDQLDEVVDYIRKMSASTPPTR